MKKQTLVAIIGLVLIIALGVYFLTKKPRGPQKMVKVGVALALTGPLAGQGQLELKAVEQAINNANTQGGVDGAQIALQVEDTQSDNKVTAAAIQRLAAAYAVPFIIGPTDTVNAQAAADAAKSQNIALISPSAALDTLTITNTNLFSLWWPQDAEADALAKFAESKHAQRVAIVTAVDSASQQLKNHLVDQLKSSDITDITSSNISPNFAQIGTTIKKNDPQIIFVTVSSGQGLGALLTDLKKKFPKALIVGDSALQNPTLLRDFGKQLTGLIYSYPHYGTADYATAIKTYQKNNGGLASDISFVPAYNAGLVAAKLLQQGATTPSSALEKLAKLDTKGLGDVPLSFGANHQLSSAPFEFRTVNSNGDYILYK